MKKIITTISSRIFNYYAARLVALILIAGLALPAPVMALTPQERQEINRAAIEIASVMQNILENYMGDITIQEMYEAALHGISTVLDENSRYISLADLASFRRDYLQNDLMFGISYFLNNDGRVQIENVITASPAYIGGLRQGEIIWRIDGVDWDSGNFSVIASRLSCPTLTSATFEVRCNYKSRSLSLTKAQVDLPTVYAVPASDLIYDAPDHIGYILISHFSFGTAREMSSAIADFTNRGITHLILDLRYNPGGDREAVTDVSRMLVPRGAIYTTINNRGHSRTVYSRLYNTPFAQMVVLANCKTASAAELLAMSLKESEAATIVGLRTFGKGSIQTLFPLLRGDYFAFTTMKYVGPKGTRINNIGVAPNIPVNVPAYLVEAINLDENNSSYRIPNLKHLLTHLGFPTGYNNTYFDQITRQSIIQIQEYYDLNPTGFIDSDTANLLDALLRIELRYNDLILAKAFQIINT